LRWPEVADSYKVVQADTDQLGRGKFNVEQQQENVNAGNEQGLASAGTICPTIR
jgi:hypothetical protein